MTNTLRMMLAVGLASASCGVAASEIPIDRWSVQTSSHATPVEEALRHLRERVRGLGGAEPREAAPGESSTRIVVEQDPDAPDFAGLADFRREECYALEPDGPDGLRVRAATAWGAALGVTDLETRLRADGGRVRVAFPEWEGENAAPIVEKPAIATRGEYLNIGYDIPGITPHQWDDAQWRRYIDGLVLARLNRWYFFLWIDSQSMFAGSKLSERPGNLRLHEGAREAIRYAHRRGLKVTFMITPTVLPRDVWEGRPEWKADIAYARDGFSCACPNAPGAWEAMKEVWRTEMGWFREADAVQVWFYDPGGCWCEKYGCKPNQAESLARQVREFGGMFRELSPGAGIEYNMWPMRLWEEEMKVEVRDDLAGRVRAALPDVAVTAVGTTEGSPAATPDRERGRGMLGGVFLFATNPESGYVFPTPHLRYLRRAMRRARGQGMDACFGHRLEASTRDVGTFLMGRWMWDPDLSIDRAVRSFGEWKTAGEATGRRLAEAVMVLDDLTDGGIRPESGRRLEALLADLPADLPAACREDLEFWPAAASALRAIGDSAGAEGPELGAHEEEFARALARGKAFTPLLPHAGETFRKYRGFLLKGWEKEVF